MLETAHVGADADACCVIHGHVDGAVERDDRPPLSASFYANSFYEGRRRVDLSRLATLLDETGGGHANACGCRIQAIDATGAAEDRPVEAEDVERNLAQVARPVGNVARIGVITLPRPASGRTRHPSTLATTS